MHRRARILVVDADRGKCELLRYLLEGQGYDVEQAQSSTEALLKVGQTPFHLVLAAIDMPGTNGLEMLRRIKEANRNTAVLVMANRGHLEHTIEAIRYSASDYLANPSENPDDVLAAVEKELSDHGAPFSPWLDGVLAPAPAV